MENLEETIQGLLEENHDLKTKCDLLEVKCGERGMEIRDLKDILEELNDDLMESERSYNLWRTIAIFFALTTIVLLVI